MSNKSIKIEVGGVDKTYDLEPLGTRGHISSGSGSEEVNTYLLVDESGNEIPAVFVSEETVFNATANDIRKGMVAATDVGVTVGEKVIPGYVTTEGMQIVPAGGAFTIPNRDDTINDYDYTKLQAIFCVFNTNTANSVYSDKVCIDGYVYPVNSTEPLAAVVKNHVNKAIEFGVTNDTGKTCVIRYFTYKEVF